MATENDPPTPTTDPALQAALHALVSQYGAGHVLVGISELLRAAAQLPAAERAKISGNIAGVGACLAALERGTHTTPRDTPPDDYLPPRGLFFVDPPDRLPVS